MSRHQAPLVAGLLVYRIGRPALLPSLSMTKKLGSATFTTVVVISAVLISLALDHFDLLGFETHAATPRRLPGRRLCDR
jgi:uncharacterized membrane protein YdcZ (DUF606 family)